MNKVNVGINGFGRIGRSFLRIACKHPLINVVAINDKADAETLTHLFKYDSIHGRFKGDVRLCNNHLGVAEKIMIGDSSIQYFNQSNIEDIRWDYNKVDVVIDATGIFRSKEQLKKHFKKGVKKVILSSPPIDDTKMIVLGINDCELKNERIISNASCTTNSAAPMVEIIDKLCGIEKAYVTTIHSYTTDQKLHDAPHKDLRRARAAAQSIVPTTTGAAKALTKVFPHLNKKIGGCGIRVPVPNGSLTDITFIVKNIKTVNQVNVYFKKMAEQSFKDILYYCEDPIVSIDVIGSPYSCVFDSHLTSVIGNMIKVVGWYDNEIGYSNRLLNLIEKSIYNV